MSIAGVLVVLAGFLTALGVSIFLLVFGDSMGISEVVWQWMNVGLFFGIPTLMYWRYTKVSKRGRRQAGRR